MGWAQTVTVIAALTAVIGLQSFWIARAIDAIRSEMHRGFDRVEGRVERLEGGGEPPSLRRV